MWSWRTLWPGTHPSRTALVNHDYAAHKEHRGGWNMLSGHSWRDRLLSVGHWWRRPVLWFCPRARCLVVMAKAGLLFLVDCVIRRWFPLSLYSFELFSVAQDLICDSLSALSWNWPLEQPDSCRRQTSVFCWCLVWGVD